MNIEICIPAFNEERIIAESARSVDAALKASGNKGFVTVVDNASTDATARVARSITGVSVLSVSIRGKGAAVVAAARHSTAEIFGFIDADLSADPEEIVTLLPFLTRQEADVVIGSRLIESSMIQRGKLRTALSRIFNLIQRVIVGVKVADTQCGLKIMNERGRTLLAACTETGWFFDMEFLAHAERAGLRIKEVPIHWNEERFPERTSKLNLVRDSIESLRAMIRIRKGMGREQH